ncbi:MAG: helix-turn-helix domain-containing protein [Alphaproteobacteria bacterium]|jgi:CRP-like cAMP-binding protein|nr:helix-turn-helix domain-containing protein [Alphaproteobacteria bacterium]
MAISLSTARNSAAFSSNRPPLDLSCAPATLADFLPEIRDYATRQCFNRNETIFNQDDPSDYVYRILTGTVRLCRYMPDGRRYIVDFLLEGDLMGFVESPDMPATAEAVTDCLIQVYPRECFDQLARGNAAIRTQLLCHLSANLLTAQQHMFVLGCQRAKERVASFLLRLADREGLSCGDRLSLPMGRQDIADHLGLTIETTSRMISALRNEEAILIPNSQQIVLRDMGALRALAAEA